MEITQKLVKSLFDYRDGFLYLKVKRKRSKIGDCACSFNKKTNRHTVMVNKKNQLASRIIFIWHNGYLPLIVDHENRNTADDKIGNLRDADYSKNGANKCSQKRAISQYLGVCPHIIRYTKVSGEKMVYEKWMANLTINGDTKYLGLFKTETAAALAYNRAAVMYHKEFANLNIIKP